MILWFYLSEYTWQTHANYPKRLVQHKCYDMDETSAETKLQNSEKSKIVSTLSEVIKVVVNDGILNVNDAVAPLLGIIKMLMADDEDMNNNKQVDNDDNL